MSGKYAKKTEKTKKSGWGFLFGVLVGAVAALAVMYAVVIPGLREDQKTPDTTPTEIMAPTGETETAGTEPAASGATATVPAVPGMDMEIETPYCTLYYPAQWKHLVEIVTDEQPEKYSVTFVGLINEKKAELFGIVFGESTEMPVGKLVMEDGTEVTVRLNVDMFLPDDSWSQEEIEKAYEMMDDSNYLLEALTELENFR